MGFVFVGFFYLSEKDANKIIVISRFANHCQNMLTHVVKEMCSKVRISLLVKPWIISVQMYNIMCVCPPTLITVQLTYKVTIVHQGMYLGKCCFSCFVTF